MWNPFRRRDFVQRPLASLNTTYECPDCGWGKFILGPQGGRAMNIKCARCGSKFWFGPPFTPTRIDNDDQFYPPHRTVNLREEIGR